MEPKYPNITVQLVGQSGNPFNVLGLVQKALRQNGVSKTQRDAFLEEATAGDYDHLLRTCMS